MRVNATHAHTCAARALYVIARALACREIAIMIKSLMRKPWYRSHLTMTMMRGTLLITLLVTVFALACAFSPATSRSSVKKASFVPPAVPLVSTRAPLATLKMSEKRDDGTFYDDEKEPEVQKSGLSDSMRERLRAEASTGLDSNQKQTNVLLYIIAGVAVLVLLGGQGIFY